MKKILAFLLVLVLGLTFIGCGEDTLPTKIEITGSQAELKVGETLALGVNVTPSDAVNKLVEWSSDKEEVATVDSNGKVTAKAEGTVKITVKAKAVEGISATVTIKVVAAVQADPTSIEVSGKSSVEVGSTLTLTAKVLPSGASQEVTYTSSDEAVATVANGVVTGVSVGSATITVATKANAEIKKEVVINVVEKGTLATDSLVISGETEVTVGNTITLSAAVESDGDKNVTWSSSDETIATVANGVVTPIKAGTVTITAALASGTSATYEITVKKAKVQGAPEYIQITGYKKHLVISDGEITLSPLLYATEEVTEQDVVWSVDKEDVATIDENGTLTPIAAGTVKVTCTSVADSSVAYSVSIEVVAEGSYVYDINSLEVVLTNGKEEGFLLHESITSNYERTLLPSDADNRDVFWETSDPSVVAISTSYRTPYIVGVGECTITCYSAYDTSKYVEIPIKVIDYVNPTSFELVDTSGKALTEIELEIDRRKTIVVSVEPSNGNPSATFTSANPEIATVSDSGEVKGIAEGTTTITVKSACEGVDFTKEVTVTIIAKAVESKEPTEVTVDYEGTMYVGYKLKLSTSVSPATASQNVVFEVNEKSKEVGSISDDGVVTAYTTGSIVFRVKCKDKPSIKTGWQQIIVKDVPAPYEVGDLKGYEILIMNAESAISDDNPFLEGYGKSDKSFKQKAWDEVQKKYNCTISVVAYPADAPWGQTRINWIINNATNGTSQTDLAVVSSNWIPDFAAGNAAVDVSDMFGKYGLSQMDPTLKAAGSYKGKLYIASTGISQTQTYADLGLYYNYGTLQKIGAENPAKLFNEGKWTYSTFKQWVLDTQAKLGENQYVLQGSPYYYWFGMTNAAGVQVVNPDRVEVNLYSEASKEASSLIYELVQAGAVNATQTWAESDDIEHSFHDGDTLMTTGYLWFIRNSGRWNKTLWGDGSTQFGYVPFPYPDDMSKEDTRISQSGLSVYMYVSGRTYPEALGKNGYEKVWAVMNEMFLNTITYQESDPLFDAEKTIEESLKGKLDDPESIKAAMYFTADKVFFDPAHGIYLSTSETPLKSAANNVMYTGKDYEEEFGSVAEKFETQVQAKFSA